MQLMDSNNTSSCTYLSPQPGRMRVAVEMLDSTLVASDMFSAIDAIAACHKAQMEFASKFCLYFSLKKCNEYFRCIQRGAIERTRRTASCSSLLLHSPRALLHRTVSHSTAQEGPARASGRELRARARGAPAAAGDRESLVGTRARHERFDDRRRRADTGSQS